MAGEGSGDVRKVLADLLGRGYDGGISIEPHIASVFHEPGVSSEQDKMRSSYLAYGRLVAKMVGEIRGQTAKA